MKKIAIPLIPILAALIVFLTWQSDFTSVSGLDDKEISLSDAKMELTTSTYCYDGEYHRPEVSVYIKNDEGEKEYISDNLYYVKYNSNKYTGIASVTVLPYDTSLTGSIKKTFVINPSTPVSVTARATTKKHIRIAWMIEDMGYHYQVSYKKTGKNNSWTTEDRTFVTEKQDGYEYLMAYTYITGLEKGEEYKVKIRATKEIADVGTLYGEWSDTVTVVME